VVALVDKWSKSDSACELCPRLSLLWCAAPAAYGACRPLWRASWWSRQKNGVQEFLDFCKAFVGTKQSGVVADDIASISGSDVSDEFFDVQLGTEVDLSWDPADAGDEVLNVSNRSLASNVMPTGKAAHLEELLDKATRDLEAMSRKLDDMQQSLSELDRLAGATPWGLYFITSLSLTLTLVLLYWGRRRN